MFASNAGTPLSFVQWLQEFKSGSIYRDMGDTLYNAYAYDRNGKYSPGYGSNFNATWRSVADDYPDDSCSPRRTIGRPTPMRTC